MDYEKAYKEALERAREIIKDYEKRGLKEQLFYAKEDLEGIFPELQESEDEKIRKGIIRCVKGNMPDNDFRKKYLAWLEKQGEQNPIINVPTREVILAIWDLGNEWKELTNGSISTEYGTQLDYIQKHWHESEYYLREKQDEKKVTTIDFNAKDWYVSKVDGKIHNMIEDKDAFTNPGVFENSLGHLLKLFEKLPKQDLLDGLKFYTNVVEHDGKYVKPTEWNDEDEKIVLGIEQVYNCASLLNIAPDKIDNVKKWLKSLKERLS